MRKLVAIALIAGLAWWLLGRRSEEDPVSATIGYDDGSSVTLEPGAPELERLLLAAAEVVGA
jgi:hypothetical protein